MSALEGLLVLDLTRHLPGPYCALLLADYGASVVKVEDRSGDPVRFLPPYIEEDGAQVSVAFRALNGGKKSLALDLKNPEGRDLLLRLVERADVLLDGFRPDVLPRLGVGWEECSRRNPRLVYGSLTGYGLEGPYADRAGHDLNYQCFAGSVHREPGQTPVVPGFQVADMTGAMALFSGILLALLARERTGKGQRVDAPLFRAAVALQPLQLVPPARGERAFAAETLAGTVPCYHLYATKDGRSIALAGLEPKFWDAFCEIVSREDWRSRAMDRELVPEVAALVATRTFDEWRMLEGAECCLSGVSSPAEVAVDPQVTSLGLIMAGTDGRAARLAPPVGLHGTPERPAVRAPVRPGEHTDEVLAERLGLDDNVLAALRARRAIF